MPNTLIEKAEALPAYLNTNCVFDEALNGLDILDSLASLGLEFVEDPAGRSSDACCAVVEQESSLGNAATPGPRPADPGIAARREGRHPLDAVPVDDDSPPVECRASP